MESVNESGEGGVGSKVQIKARGSEGCHPFYINHEIFKTFLICALFSLSVI